MARPLCRPDQDRWPVIVAWSTYDLANTVFYLAVVTIFVPKYLRELSGRESAFALAFYPAMGLSALLSPLFGELLDRLGRARAWTLIWTVLCCAGTVLLAVPGSWVAVASWFAVALFAYQMAAVSYNTILPAIASPARVGRVSGVGVALGYLGNILFLLALNATGAEERFGVRGIFLIAAGLFLLLSLPLALRVPPIPAARPRPVRARDLLQEVPRSLTMLARTLGRGALGRFLLGNLLVCDAVATVLVQVARYAEHEGGLGLSPEQRNLLLLVINGMAVLGGFATGALADRWSGRTVTVLSGVLLGAGMAIGQFGGLLSLRVAAMALFCGVGLAGIWTAGRLWVVRLVPPSRVGEAFGLYGFTMKVSLLTLFPFTWLVDRTGFYGGSVALLLGVLAAGVLLWVATPASVGPAPEADPTSSG